jgi:hypothetical protein
LVILVMPRFDFLYVVKYYLLYNSIIVTVWIISGVKKIA